MSSIAETRLVATSGRVEDCASAAVHVYRVNRKLRLPAFGMLIGAATVLAGCAVQPLPRPAQVYGCEDGSEFSLSVSSSGDTADIEIARMHFGLVADAPAGPGEKFSCSMLTLWRQGEVARVDMDGAPQFHNCRAKR